MVTVRPNPEYRANNPFTLPFTVEFPPVMFGYTLDPMAAWLRTPEQFVLLFSDYGMVDTTCVETALTFIEEMKELPLQPRREEVKLRALHDSFNNGFTFYVDYFIDSLTEASMTKQELLGILGHGRNRYGARDNHVDATFRRDLLGHDSYRPFNDGYYQRNFSG